MIIVIDMSGKQCAYESSIQQLRSCLVLMGRSGYFQLDIVLNEGAAPAVSLVMNRKSLYIDGFLAGGKWYYFSDSPKPSCHRLGIGGNTVKLKMKGTHGLFKTDAEATKFEPSTKKKLIKLTEFDGVNDTGADLRTAMSFAAVACAEASRFKEVQDKIEALLTGAIDAYKPRADCEALFKNWHALTVANSAKVWVQHVD